MKKFDFTRVKQHILSHQMPKRGNFETSLVGSQCFSKKLREGGLKDVYLEKNGLMLGDNDAILLGPSLIRCLLFHGSVTPLRTLYKANSPGDGW